LRPQEPGALRQSFLGQEVRTRRAVFDPGVATLMDFRVDQLGGVRFVYVLPFAPDRALVEDTSIAVRSVPAAARRAAIRHHLRDRHGVGVDDLVVEHEERGVIPMTTAARPVRLTPRLRAIGLAGGAARPSSGYAFARIQQQVDSVAAAAAAGREPLRRPQSAGLELMDRVFLRALEEAPDTFPATMAGLLRSAPPEALARFMNDASSRQDELRIAWAMPLLPFARAALADSLGLVGAAGAVALERLRGR
jgi:lycopene beta-cyclase